MAKLTKNRLTAASVKQARKPGYFSDGGGLVLQVTATGGQSWLFRYRVPGGKIREMGLGSASVVTLADARRKAEQAQRQRSDGFDPIEVRRDLKAQSQLDAVRGVTFKNCARQFIETNASGWKNVKHVAQWTATLETYAYPMFGNLPVAAIDTSQVLRAIEPIWSVKPETASRVRQRIERVLSWATVRGYRSGANPAQWKGNLDQILPKLSKVRKVKHHRALPPDDVAELMNALKMSNGGSAVALRFLTLTAARTGEVLGALWPEIDLKARLWTIPAERMKARKEHRVPLSEAAIDVLTEAKKSMVNDVVFSGQTPGRALSDMAMIALLRRMKRFDVVPHGLRATFRTWCAERTNYPREVCEMALAHTIKDATEAAYQRSDMMERRRQLMDDWAKFALGVIQAGAMGMGLGKREL